MTLRIASYNIHKCIGMDRRRDPARIAQVIAQLGADVIALQEVDFRLPPRRAALPAPVIAARTELRPLPFALTDESFGWHGQTILLHHRLTATAIRRIALPGLEPRGAILTEIVTDHGPLRLVGVHLGLIRRYRRMQLAAIAAALGRRPQMPTAVIGDFNEWSRRDGAEALGRGYRLHAPGPSFPAPRAIGALDRVALGAGLHLQDAGVFTTPVAQRASDHLPIWADIRIDPEHSAR